MVAAFALGVLALTALVWAIINTYAGPTMATGVIALVLIIGIGATIIDYLTEKR
jgi:hypothetical protein